MFTRDASRRIFESALERVRRSFRLEVYGYVVMPEHVHLLLSEPQRDTFSDRTAPLKPKSGLSGPPVLLGEPEEDTLAAYSIFPRAEMPADQSNFLAFHLP
ncbi:MAG: transposase [Acidobacteriia bacterium]|nr:transposase [Terriglobia bacterium]